MKIITIVGARPQFVKEAVIQREFQKHGIEEVLVHTGQHYDSSMSNAIFKDLEISDPNYNLNINGLSHGEMTGKMIIELEKIFLNEQPDCVLVYGDTNSTLAAAIAACKIDIPIAHVEAGLRQEPKNMPEEKNRILTDHISSKLYVPSKKAAKTLHQEGITQGVVFSGDVMYDVFLQTKNYFDYSTFNNLKLKKNSYAVLTLHRDFNVDNPQKLLNIVEGLNRVANEITIVFPIHPRTLSRLKSFDLLDRLNSNILIINPLPYLDLMGLTQFASFVITDSGGYQKESYFSGKPGLVLMPDTSWIELIENNINHLVNGDTLFEMYTKLGSKTFVSEIYGKGNAAEIIVDDLANFFDPIVR